MATKAFQKIYTKISQITKATCSLKATGVGYDELAMVNGKLAQVVKIMGDEVTLQVFQGTEGIPTNAEVVFLGKSPSLKVSEQLAGRFFKLGDLPKNTTSALVGIPSVPWKTCKVTSSPMIFTTWANLPFTIASSS